jgi:hypothetical protein
MPRLKFAHLPHRCAKSYRRAPLPMIIAQYDSSWPLHAGIAFRSDRVAFRFPGLKIETGGTQFCRND